MCLLLFVLFAASCGQLKLLRVNDGQFLLNKNKYTLEDVNNREEIKAWEYELDEYSKQKPNALTLWLPVRLWLYNAATYPSKDSSKIRMWALRKGGEPPIISDTTLLRKSAISMRNYLYNKGYFNAKVKYSRDTMTTDKKRKRGFATHKYSIKLNKIYTIDSLSILANNPELEDLIREHTTLKHGTPITQKNFETERSNIARLLKNNGYFYIAPSLISFEGDTIKGLPISNVRIKMDTTQRYFKYSLHKVRVFTDIGAKGTIEYDTIINYKGIDFYENNNSYLKRKILERFFYFNQNSNFKIDDFDKTLKRLREIGIYKFTEIKFDNADSADLKRIDCTIRLTPAKRWDGGFDFDVRNSVFNNQKLNVAFGPSFRNKNTFSGAEQLNLSMEINTDLGLKNETFKNWEVKKDLNFHAQAELILPRLYIPFFNIKDNEVRNRAKTRYSVDYNQQNAYNESSNSSGGVDVTEFRSRTFAASAGWDWYETITKRHQFNPIFIASQNISVSDNLIQNNEFLRMSLQNQFIVGSTYAFTYTPPSNNKNISWLFKGGIEESGALSTAIGIINKKTIKVDTTPIAKFLRFEPDVRVYKGLGGGQMLAFRLAGGIGVSFGEQGSALPFNRQFFVGGANSIRAWNIRRIGPGATPKPVDAKSGYQTGDSKLEASLEYRIPATKMINFAAFIDAGNVWYSADTPSNLYGKFDIKTFHEQLAVGAGLGLRLDFSYFLVRGDFAWALRYPYLQKTTFDNDIYADLPSNDADASHWRQVKPADLWRHFVSPFFNLALNYPF